MTRPDQPLAPAPAGPGATADAYRAGMSRLAAGVCLITSSRANALSGMIATAVTSVSADPPTLLICLNRNASLFDIVKSTGTFCVNVLTTQAVALADVFSNSARRAERFQGGEWRLLPSGAPMCADALVAFDCQVAKVIDWHTHGIFLGQVRTVVHSGTQAKPLLYMDRRFHHLGDVPVSG
ncbi:flavin reductase [Pseudomonas typographi]|uniref:flavin reductase n=1 Tax=Pseudomonas typographi TaxID=2715964 RepID=UPI001683F56F|nr:flavin reductase [Pseudomonas typographi]MBD1550298.1 flavin reductase [Pseudomonas typographi]